MTNYIQLPLSAAKHDLGTVFDATGESFCVSHGMQDEVAEKAAYIVQVGNLFGPLVAVAQSLVEATDYPSICEARNMARELLQQVGQALPDDDRGGMCL